MLSPVQNDLFPEVITNDRGEVEAMVFIARPEQCPNITMIRAFAAAWDKHHTQLSTQRSLYKVSDYTPGNISYLLRQIEEELTRTVGRRVRLVHKHDHRGQEGDLPRGFYYGINKEEWEAYRGAA